MPSAFSRSVGRANGKTCNCRSGSSGFSPSAARSREAHPSSSGGAQYGFYWVVRPESVSICGPAEWSAGHGLLPARPGHRSAGLFSVAEARFCRSTIVIDVQFFEVFDEQAYSVLLCVGAIAGAVLIESAGRKFRRVSAKYTGRISACGLSGKQVAQRLLATAGVTDVDVKSGGKKDVYSPWQKEIQLTAATASSPSICALATAAHEVGHAQQFAEDYAPARWWRQVSPYAFWLPVLVILAIPAALFGWIDLSLTTISWAAPLLFVVLVAVQLPIHLPLERNASRRARKWVQQQNLVTTDELPIFDELLHSAWKTHVAAQCGQWIMVGAVVAVVCLAPSYFLPLETVSPPLGAGGEGWLVAVPPDFEAPQQPVEIPENPFLEILFSGGFLLLWGIAGFTALVFLSKVKDLTTYEPTLEEQAVELNNAGRKLQVAGDRERALVEYGKSIKANPESAIVWHNRGQTHFELGRLDDARTDFDQALRLAPHFVEALAGRGVVRAWQDDLDRAWSDAARAVQINPENNAARSCRGTVYQARGDYRNAVAEFTAAIELDPNCGDHYRDRGLVHLCLQQLDKALADATRAIELNPADSLAWNNRGATRIKLGEYRDALNDLERAVKLQPDLPHPLRHIAWIQATSSEPMYRNGAEAVINATKAMEATDWQRTDWLPTLAAAHAEAGNFRAAIKYQRQWVDHCADQDRTESQARLAQYKAGQPMRAEPIDLALDDQLISHENTAEAQTTAAAVAANVGQ